MTNKELGLKKVLALVERFKEHQIIYKKTEYNETQTRRDFIDPFFKALGWDIDNEQGFSESYREVIHEDKIKISGGTKAPDYSFRLTGKEKLFFLEAKKPNINIKDHIDPAYQIKRYGWNAKMTVSVLTDFEELSIYDCTKEPNSQDSPAKARLNYTSYDLYEKEWDFLWNVLSKEAAQNGGFNEYLKKVPQKKGVDTVDKKFLKSLDEWRTLLAETISKENKQLDEDELNFVVQQTLDRIIFLRICEDRSIEPYGRLKDCLNRGDYYENLLLEFKQADDKYNSGLFNFKKDKLSHQLKINNNTLKTIISQLYYPECPYEFSVLSVEILGSAYEQFLGKTITINNKGKAVIELKPEVRKAGGVYYTPQYIVDYIVSNTVGKLCEKKTPTQVAEIKIVDPACGSGSFLIGAYQYLLNWHKDYYLQNPNKKNPLTPEGNLTTPEKKKILLNNIFGVDIDTNAVEVTKLSLLLKCMEGETQASISHQMKMFNERVLPTLDDNIKNGNSLIDTDYYDTQLDFGEERIIKPFSWQKAYPTVFKNGGFDVVIGNPPWVSLNGKFGNDILNSQAQKYLIRKYSGNTYRPNLYEYFVHKGLELINESGYFTFIVPDRLGYNEQFISLREKILRNFKVEELLYKAPFPGIVTDTVIFRIINKNEPESNNYKISVGEFGKKLQTKNVNDYLADTEKKFAYESNDESTKVLDKIFKNKRTSPFAEIIESKTGVILDTKQVTKEKTNNKQIKIAKGRSIGKFSFLANFFCEFGPNTIKGGTNNVKKLGVKEKVLLRKTGFPIIATFDDSGMYPEQSLYFLINNKTNNSLKYFTALINSNLFQFVFINKLVTNKDSTPQLKKVDLDKFPVFVCDFKNKDEKAKHDDIVKQVNLLLKFNEELKETTFHNKIEHLNTRIEHCEESINIIISELYGLTKTDIETVDKYDEK
jgi:hypothetical protein